jgi:sialidase-1
MVIACDHNRGAEERYSHVIYSDDHGAHWKIGGVVGSLHNESTIAELSDGSLLLNMRSYAKRNRRSVATSHDGGLTFSNSSFDEALIEPVCQGSLIRLGKGRKAVLLFANPASTKRENMTVRLSRDNGQTWPDSKVIHKGPAAYSNLAGLKDGSIGLLYEKGERGPYEVIRFRF